MAKVNYQNLLRQATWPVSLNLAASIVLIAVLLLFGSTVTEIDYADFTVELTATITSFAVFLVVSAVKLRARFRVALLLGLAAFQLGHIADALDEIIYFNSQYWNLTGDLITVIGEVTIEIVAVLFVIETNFRANTDPLTQLYNRRYHETVIERAIRNYQSHDQKFAIIALDLDHFKDINDHYGHSIGDAALKHTATLLKKCGRRQDIVSRVGGEEFEILVNVQNEKQAIKIAERIRRKIENNPPSELKHLTASIGVAVYKADETIEQLRNRADLAVYTSKKAGRNRVSAADAA